MSKFHPSIYRKPGSFHTIELGAGKLHLSERQKNWYAEIKESELESGEKKAEEIEMHEKKRQKASKPRK